VEQKKDGETMYGSMGANSAGDEDFQRTKKHVFIMCYGATVRPPTREIPKPWVCTLCAVGKQPAFEDRAELKDHEVEAHPFECPIDGKRFDTAEDRRIHMRRCHKPDGFVMEMALVEREKVRPAAQRNQRFDFAGREFDTVFLHHRHPFQKVGNGPWPGWMAASSMACKRFAKR
jgi:hypothetical protein